MTGQVLARMTRQLAVSHPGAGARNYFSGAATGLAWVVADGPAWAAAHAAFGMALAA
jgi:hypothetical protein